MIVTVTMNPAIDKMVDIGRLERGGLNRITHVEMDMGGKGIYVSRIIAELGGESIVVGFIGGSSGKIISHVLNRYGITTDFVEVEGDTRTNLKVMEENGEVTELNEPGPVVSSAQLNELMQKLDSYACSKTLFVLAGSVPTGVPADIYRTITERMHRNGAKVLIDADNALFANALEALPDMIKIKRTELERLYDVDYRSSEKELTAMGRRLIVKGINRVVISQGQMGAMFLSGQKGYRCPGLQVKPRSTVGAGAALAAAMAYSWDKGLTLEASVRMSMGAYAGAVTTLGTKPPAKSLIEELAAKVELLEII